MRHSGGEWTAGVEAFLRELGWREFAYHVLYHHPQTQHQPLRPEFTDFPWSTEKSPAFKAWTKGRTGIPMVDAGMRQLWHIGWMHNRVRMIVASWLTKNLLIHWRLGEAWFWDTLVDADPASNVLGWQWTAGCGADAAPYPRIFNPVLQGRKFDPEGAYVRRWVPELAHLPNEYIHAPWEAPPDRLQQAGIVLGHTYPHPQESLEKSRLRALELFEQWTKRRKG
jgi:deoxyribodipyrimidine photo-lyase